MDASRDGSVADQPCVTVTLISDLVSRIPIVSSAYLILLEVGIPNLMSKCILGWQSVAYNFWVTDLDLLPSF